MPPIVPVLFFATLCTGLAVGVRLLWLYRETKGTPELAIGLAALCVCLSGVVRAALLRLGEGTPAAAVDLVHVTFLLLFAAAPACMVLGTWRVFRPDERWAAILALSIVALLALTVPARLMIPAWEVSDSLPGLAMLGLALIVSVWTGVEALLHHARLRRRMRLGLADPITVNQFLSWGVGMASNSILRVVTIVLVAGTGVEPMQNPSFLIPAALLGFTTLTCLYFAFFPPLAFQDWLTSRTAEARA